MKFSGYIPAAAFALLVVLMPTLGSAQKCSRVQLTEGAEIYSAGSSYRGRWLVFGARGGFFSQPSRRQLYLLDVKTGDLERITRFPGSGYAGGLPAIDKKGKVVAFSSRADRTGENPDRNPEIFVLYPSTGELRQVTHTEEFRNRLVGIDSNGKYVLVKTENGLVKRNRTGEEQLFSINLNTGKIRRLTKFKKSIYGVRVGPRGKWILFASSADPVGDNPDENQEVFLLQVSTGKISQTSRTTSGYNTAFSLDAGAKRILFAGISPAVRGLVLYDRRQGTFELVPLGEQNRGALHQAIISENGKMAWLNFESWMIVHFDLNTSRQEVALDALSSSDFSFVWVLDAGRKGKLGVLHSQLHRDLFLLSCPSS